MIKSITAKSPYLADIIQFFKKPGLYLPAKKASFKDFLILVLAKFIFIFPIILLTDYLSGDRFDSNVFDDLDDKPYLLFFAVVILAPMGEELYFRYH
jgi:membrane protease YdiL (CAAX protease family)